MINLDTATINIPCPECKFANSVTIQDIRTQKKIICRGCKKNIQLIDKNASTTKAKKDIEESINDLKKTIKDINIEIKL